MSKTTCWWCRKLNPICRNHKHRHRYVSTRIRKRSFCWRPDVHFLSTYHDTSLYDIPGAPVKPTTQRINDTIPGTVQLATPPECVLVAKNVYTPVAISANVVLWMLSLSVVVGARMLWHNGVPKQPRLLRRGLSEPADSQPISHTRLYVASEVSWKNVLNHD